MVLLPRTVILAKRPSQMPSPVRSPTNQARDAFFARLVTFQEAHGQALAKILPRLRLRVRNAKVFLKKHLVRKRPDRTWFLRLARHSINMARLDPLHRRLFGVGTEYLKNKILESASDACAEEVADLLGHVPWERFIKGGTCQWI
jgi:hypothetical protein